MGFSSQLEKLRLITKNVLESRAISQKDLAAAIGVASPMLSNFLSGRRGISWKTADHLKSFLRISDQDLLDSPIHTDVPSSHTVPVVTQLAARLESVITPDLVRRSSGIPVYPLRQLPAFPTAERLPWTRFVAIEVTLAQVKFLHPRFPYGTLLVLDRHYQQLPADESSSKNDSKEKTLYVIADRLHLAIGYARLSQNATLIFAGNSTPRLVAFDSPEQLSSLIVGRVCKVLGNL